MEETHFELIACVVTNNATEAQQAQFDTCFTADAAFRDHFHKAQQLYTTHAVSDPLVFDPYAALALLKKRLHIPPEH